MLQRFQSPPVSLYLKVRATCTAISPHLLYRITGLSWEFSRPSPLTLDNLWNISSLSQYFSHLFYFISSLSQRALTKKRWNLAKKINKLKEVSLKLESDWTWYRYLEWFSFDLNRWLKQFRLPCFYWNCFTVVSFYLSGSIYLWFFLDPLNSILVLCIFCQFSFGSHYIFFLNSFICLFI